MNKKPKLNSTKQYYSIREVVEKCGIAAHVLRYWETVFPKLNPIKRRSRRYYQLKDIELIETIKELVYRRRFTIEGARKYLQSRTAAVKLYKITPVEEIIKSLEEMREILDNSPTIKNP